MLSMNLHFWDKIQQINENIRWWRHLQRKLNQKREMGDGGEKRLKANKSEWPGSINKIQQCSRRSECTSIHVYGTVPQAEIIEKQGTWGILNFGNFKENLELRQKRAGVGVHCWRCLWNLTHQCKRLIFILNEMGSYCRM